VRAYATNSIGTSYGSQLSIIYTSPTVTTTAISAITQTSATSGGNVTLDGGSSVTARGVCWNTTGTPVSTDSHTTDGTGTGIYTSSITGLSVSNTYYVRAYATNSVGTSYGSQLSIIYTSPTVTTTAISSIMAISATSGGNVTNNGNSSVTARGVCWNTTGTPTITADNFTTDGTGTGIYTSSITGLSVSNTYYVRAYATNSVGTAYGLPLSFIAHNTFCTPPTSTDPCYIMIANVSTTGGITNFDNPSDCSGTSYTDYSSSDSVSQAPGGTVNMSFTSSNNQKFGFALNYSVWIDFNDDATFSPDEQVIAYDNSFTEHNPVDTSFTVPVSATPGQHRMRVRGDDIDYSVPSDPCAALTDGETEDYKIIIVENTWTGTTSINWSDNTNWSTNLAPTSSGNAYIPSAPVNQPHVTAASACKNLTISGGANLTIDAGNTLTISGVFTIKSDATGTGSFIDNGTLSVTGATTVEKYLTDSRWWYIGTPMNSTNASAFGTLSATPSSGKRLEYYDEVGQTYTAVADGATLNTALRGYTFKNFNTGVTTAAFTGTLNTGAIGTSTNLTRQTSGTFNGYNLVCNPYPSAINWGSSGTPTTGLTQTNLEPTVWYRTNSSFATYNWTSGTGQNTGQAIIPAMQAFWIRVATGQTTGGLELTNETRLHSSQSFYKKAAESNVFRIEVSRDTLSDEAVVGFYPNAQSVFEGYDSEKMFSTENDYPQIYTLTTDNTEVAINGFAELVANEERIVPLGFLTNVAGTHTLQATNLNDFDQNISIYIEDVQQNVLKDLRQNSSYTFTSGAVNNANRFRLHFGNIAANISNTAANTSILIYAVNNTVYVNTPETGKGIIEIYDMLGKKIMSQQSVQGLNKLQPNVSGGIYIVKVQSSDRVVNQKVYLP
jgi:hypothetical protein